MPVGNVLVCDTRRDIEHDDTTLSVDIVAISESTELFLPGGVPYIELDASVVLQHNEFVVLVELSRATYCCESERVHLNT